MIKGKKICAIIPARMTSNRLPGKVMVDICGKPSLQRIIERVSAAKLVDEVIIATTTNKDDDCIKELCKKLDVKCFRGSEEGIFDRVLKPAIKYKVDIIVDVTGDCPFIYWEHIDMLVDSHMKNRADITMNILTRTYPRGFDIRVVNIDALKRARKEVDNEVDLQHVFTWMYLNPKGSKKYKVKNHEAVGRERRPDIDVTLDTPEDLELIRWLYGFETQGYNMEMNCEQVINLIDGYPMMYEKVGKVQRKDYFKELKHAKKIKK